MCITYHRKTLLGSNLMVTIFHANVLEGELLLVYGSRGQQGCFYTFLEP